MTDVTTHESAAAGHHGHEDHGHGHGHEPARLREALQERLVELRGLSWELKSLVLLSGLILAFLAVMAALRNQQIGTLVTNNFFSEEGDKPASVSQVVFVASIGFMCVAWSLLVTAAARAGWIVRLATLAALAISFGSTRLAVTDLNLSTTIIVSVLLGLVAVIIVGTWFPERNVSHQHDPKHLSAARSWLVLRRLVLPVTFLIFLAIYLYIWHVSQDLGMNQGPDGEYGSDIGVQLYNMQWLLIPMLVLAGADFGDWGYFAAGRAFRRARLWSSELVTVGLGLVISIAIVADGLRIAHSDDGAGIVPELVMAAIVAAVTALVMVVAQPRGGWTSHYPFAIVAAVVAFDGASTFVITKLVDKDESGFKVDGYDALTWLVLGAVGLLVVLAFRRRGPGWLPLAGAFAALVGVVYTMTSLDSITEIVHFNGWNPDVAPWLSFEGLKAAAGIIAIAVIVFAAATRRLREWSEPITLLVGVAVAIQVLAWINSAYGGAINHSGTAAKGGQLALFAAMVMVLALSWEFAASGESITNGHARRFPRDSRVMAFVGYVLLTATVSVFWSSIGEVEDGKWKLIESQFEAESFVQSGLLFVGVPLVLLIFVLRFNTWRQNRGEGVSSHRPGEVHAGQPIHTGPAPASS